MKQVLKTSLYVILAIFFAMAGGAKLVNPDAHAENFENWGYPLWFLYVTGMIELGGAIGLLIPTARFFSTLVLMATMMGAALTHLRVGEMEAVPIPATVLAFLIVPAWWLRPLKTR